MQAIWVVIIFDRGDLVQFQCSLHWSDEPVALELSRCCTQVHHMTADIVTLTSFSEGNCWELDHKIKSSNGGIISFIVHCEFLLIASYVLLFFYFF